MFLQLRYLKKVQVLVVYLDHTVYTLRICLLHVDNIFTKVLIQYIYLRDIAWNVTLVVIYGFSFYHKESLQAKKSSMNLGKLEIRIRVISVGI